MDTAKSGIDGNPSDISVFKPTQMLTCGSEHSQIYKFRAIGRNHNLVIDLRKCSRVNDKTTS